MIFNPVYGGSSAPNLGSKTITANGTYLASADNLDGYDEVTANVPNTYAAADEGKVVNNGALAAQTSRNITANGTYDTTLNNEVVVNVPGSSPTLITKNITANGTYNASDDNADGYSQVVVNVSGGGGAAVLHGTDTPASSVGDNGDLYLEHFPTTAPTGYTALNYVQFVNGGYIDTGIIPNDHTVDAYFYDASYTNDKHWFGTSTGYAYFSFTTYNNKYYWGRNGSNTNGGAWTSGRHHLQYNKGTNYQVILDGTTLGSGSLISASQPLLVGARGTSATAANLRVLTFKLYNKSNNSLVLDLIPAKRNSDNVIGFYDTVSSSFFTNAGSGTFISGGDATGQIINAYAKVSGAWQNLIGASINNINLGS